MFLTEKMVVKWHFGPAATLRHPQRTPMITTNIMVVVQGCYTLIIEGERIPVGAGEEYFIARGVLHSGEVLAGTRTIHAFGGHRAERVKDS
jgi:mannose-6-phosphate isomerase class I